jgi:hypothetical protein
MANLKQMWRNKMRKYDMTSPYDNEPEYELTEQDIESIAEHRINVLEAFDEQD